MTNERSEGTPLAAVVRDLFRTARSGLCVSVVMGAALASAADSADFESFYASKVSLPTIRDLAPTADIVGRGRSLGVDEAIAMAIGNNLAVAVERFGPLIAEAEASAAMGVYDPTLRADFRHEIEKTPLTSALAFAAATRDRTNGGGIGVEQEIPLIGATVSARYEARSLLTRLPTEQLSPRYDSSFFLTGRIPLLRGLVWNENWTNVKLRDIQSDAARDTFSLEAMDIVRETADAYWSLVAARDRVRVVQKSLETSRALAELARNRLAAGVASRLSVVEAEAGVAEREFDVITAANAYRRAQDVLVARILGRGLSAETQALITPEYDPLAFETRTPDLSRAVEIAFRERPELAQARRRIEESEVELKLAQNQLLPQLDVEASFGYVGISGDPNPGGANLDFINVPGFTDPFIVIDADGAPPLQTGGFTSSDNRFFNRSGSENYSVRGVFSIPFPNTTARKRAVSRKLEFQRAKTNLAWREQEVVLEVRDAVRNLMASAMGIEAAERRRLMVEEQLRSERDRLEHGESTPFDVLQRESDLVDAESKKIAAVQTYRSAEIGLERAQGTILDFYDVVLDESGE